MKRGAVGNERVAGGFLIWDALGGVAFTNKKTCPPLSRQACELRNLGRVLKF